MRTGTTVVCFGPACGTPVCRTLVIRWSPRLPDPTARPRCRSGASPTPARPSPRRARRWTQRSRTEKRQPWRQLLQDGTPAELVEIARIVDADDDLSNIRSRVPNDDEIRELRDRFEQMARENGKWTPHDLRRTSATMMQALGVMPNVIDRCQKHVLAGSRVRRHDDLEHDHADETKQAWAKLGAAIEAALARRLRRVSGSP
jgi:integrase